MPSFWSGSPNGVGLPPEKFAILNQSFLLCLFWLEERAEAMKASWFTDSHKAFFGKQGDECAAVAEICRKAGISPATYFAGRKSSKS